MLRRVMCAPMVRRGAHLECDRIRPILFAKIQRQTVPVGFNIVIGMEFWGG